MARRRAHKPISQRVLGAIDASRITEDIYQGARPPTGKALTKMGFDGVVLTAVEFQPPASKYPGVHVIHAPMEDDGEPINAVTWENAVTAASQVNDLVRQGGRVLVTCYQGLNRSGLVVALALLMLTDLHPDDIVNLIQARRPGALFNRRFVRAIELTKG
jgi:protein-tyrosine phosphatase